MLNLPPAEPATPPQAGVLAGSQTTVPGVRALNDRIPAAGVRCCRQTGAMTETAAGEETPPLTCDIIFLLVSEIVPNAWVR